MKQRINMSVPKVNGNGKTTKNSTNGNAINNNGTWSDYYNFLRKEVTLVNKSTIQQFINRMIDWSMQPKSIALERFYTNEGMNKKTYYRLKQMYPELNEAHEFVLERIGINRETICDERNLHINSVLAFTIPHYLDRFEAQIIKRAQLRNDSEKNQTQVVVIERFPE